MGENTDAGNQQPDAGIKTNTPEKNLVDEAREEREKLDKSRDELKKENDRTEKLMAQRELAGKSVRTTQQPESEMEKYARETEEKYRGTGLNPALGYKRKF